MGFSRAEYSVALLARVGITAGAEGRVPDYCADSDSGGFMRKPP